MYFFQVFIMCSIPIQSHRIFPCLLPFPICITSFHIDNPLSQSCLLSSFSPSFPLLHSPSLPLVVRLEEHNAGIKDLISNFRKCHRKWKQASGKWEGLDPRGRGIIVGTQSLEWPWLRGSCRDPVPPSYLSEPCVAEEASDPGLSPSQPSLMLPHSFLWKSYWHFLPSYVQHFFFCWIVNTRSGFKQWFFCQYQTLQQEKNHIFQVKLSNQISSLPKEENEKPTSLRLNFGVLHKEVSE